jgi:hypothetical protein
MRADFEARFLPEQIRLGLARAGCLLAVDRLLAVQLKQIDDLDSDNIEDDLDLFDPTFGLASPTTDTTGLDEMVTRLRGHDVLTATDAEVVLRLRLRAADVALQLPNLLLDSGAVHDLELLLATREVIARAGVFMARLNAGADPAFDHVELDDVQAQSALALFAGQLVDAVQDAA